MAQFKDRDLHLVKKALLDRLIASDVELEHYTSAARIAITGDPD
jgi:hypothetical protein